MLSKPAAARKKRSVTFSEVRQWFEDGRDHTESKPARRRSAREMVREFEREMVGAGKM